MSRHRYIGRGYCENCEKDVRVVMIDMGIGPYEYWGSKGNHHAWTECCEECESPVDDYDEDDYEPEYNEDEFDR